MSLQPLPPSNDVHGICNGAPADCGMRNDAKFVHGGSGRRRVFAPAVLSSAEAAIPGKEEDDVQVVAAEHPS